MRTHIQLTPDQHRRLKRWARQHGISLSEAVRRCVDICTTRIADKSVVDTSGFYALLVGTERDYRAVLTSY